MYNNFDISTIKLVCEGRPGHTDNMSWFENLTKWKTKFNYIYHGSISAFVHITFYVYILIDCLRNDGNKR